MNIAVVNVCKPGFSTAESKSCCANAAIDVNKSSGRRPTASLNVATLGRAVVSATAVLVSISESMRAWAALSPAYSLIQHSLKLCCVSIIPPIHDVKEACSAILHLLGMMRFFGKKAFPLVLMRKVRQSACLCGCVCCAFSCSSSTFLGPP
jgi:hypothetical protein